jgi:hypothetical protein
MEPTVSGSNVSSLQLLLEVPTVFWPIVALYHSERKTKGCLGSKDSLSG